MMRAEPNITVLYPCDAVSTERLVELMAYHRGPAYIRTSRPKTPVIYGTDETFTIGGLKVLRESGRRRRDRRSAPASRCSKRSRRTTQLRKRRASPSASSISIRVQPVDAATLVRCARETTGPSDHGRGPLRRGRHRRCGGGGGCAGRGFTVHRLAVREIPRSGHPEELLDRYGISARHIVAAVQGVSGRVRRPETRRDTVMCGLPEMAPLVRRHQREAGTQRKAEPPGPASGRGPARGRGHSPAAVGRCTGPGRRAVPP